ncbi:MAG: phosphoenolpyruvate carboxykinase [Anaerolineales bacterium]
MTEIQKDFKFIDNKFIIHSSGRLCDSQGELLKSRAFRAVLEKILADLQKRNSRLLKIFGGLEINPGTINLLIETLQYLTILESSVIPNILPGSAVFFEHKDILESFIEHLYDSWRNFDRFVIVSSLNGDGLDDRPYRTFNATVERLMHIVISAYRDIQENITGNHPRVYRQARAGVDMGAIVSDNTAVHSWSRSAPSPYSKLAGIPLIRQILLNPPLVLNQPTNKRQGQFQRVSDNPLALVDLDQGEWTCYPVLAGDLLILTYIHERFLELGMSLCNLFELAREEDLERTPDAIYLYGVPGDVLDRFGDLPTVFYDDSENDILVGAVPNQDRFAYFGYLKKMILTLHNIKMMKRGSLPFHGALVKILVNDQDYNVLLVGESGAGKSETLEAFRVQGDSLLQDMLIIADDMGSLHLDDGQVRGYGSEIGAFIRLDDLQPGYEFGQMGRAIFLNPSNTNARLLLPVTTYALIREGIKVNYIFYANNYQVVDSEHPIIERFPTSEQALEIFREGKVMSKGTTTAEGIVRSYFGNIFGPPQYRDLHESLAVKYFEHFFQKGCYVGQIRTQLAIPGKETSGPQAAARALIDLFTREGS